MYFYGYAGTGPAQLDWAAGTVVVSILASGGLACAAALLALLLREQLRRVRNAWPRLRWALRRQTTKSVPA